MACTWGNGLILVSFLAAAAAAVTHSHERDTAQPRTPQRRCGPAHSPACCSASRCDNERRSMPVKTQWTVTYDQCGHTETKDLSHKQAADRAGFVRWLAAKQLCTACWRDQQGLPPQREWIDDKEEWLAAKRADDAREAAEWASRTGMPELTGRSEKAIEWATRVRYELMHQLYTWCVEEDQAPDEYDGAEEITRGLDQAGWWLDQREQATDEPETLLELLHSAADTGEGADCENTY